MPVWGRSRSRSFARFELEHVLGHPDRGHRGRWEGFKRGSSGIVVSRLCQIRLAVPGGTAMRRIWCAVRAYGAPTRSARLTRSFDERRGSRSVAVAIGLVGMPLDGVTAFAPDFRHVPAVFADDGAAFPSDPGHMVAVGADGATALA